MRDNAPTEGGSGSGIPDPFSVDRSSRPPAAGGRTENAQKQRPTAMPKFQAGWIREVAQRSRAGGAQTTTTSLLLTQPSGGGDDSSQRRQSRLTKHFRREYAFYCTPKGMIPGMLAISEQLITFEPDRRGQEVRRLGVGEFQVVIPISMVSETAAVVLPRTAAIEGLFNLPQDRVDKHGMELPVWAHQRAQEEEDPAIGLLQILLKTVHTSKQKKRISPDKVERRRSYSPPSNKKIDRDKDKMPAKTVFVSRASDGSMDSNQSSRRRSAARHADMTQVPGRMRRRSGTLDAKSSAATAKRGPVDQLSLTEAPPPQSSSIESEPHYGPVTMTNSPRCRRMNHPQSFVLFRVGSTTAVREVTRLLLDIIDEHNACIARRGGNCEGYFVEPSQNTPEHAQSNPVGPMKEAVVAPAFVPFYSDQSLDLLMTLCVDTLSSPGHSEGLHGPSSSEQPSEVHSGSHHPSTESVAWLFRTSPPKLDMPIEAVSMMTENMAIQLSAALPPTVALRRWRLLFDTNLHGVSLLSFYRQTEGHAPALLLIRDDGGRCFGGYNPDGFKESRHYYGSGEAFVFTFRNFDEGKPRQNWGEVLSSSEPTGPILEVFPWSGANSFFIYSDCERIMFGGGGSYAFAIDADLLQGNSSKCATFENRVLTNSEDFVVREMQVGHLSDCCLERSQVWGFEPL